MTNATDVTVVMIYFIFVQRMSLRIMQTMRERLEYDLMTESAKFMQQTSLLLSEGDNDVCTHII